MINSKTSIQPNAQYLNPETLKVNQYDSIVFYHTPWSLYTEYLRFSTQPLATYQNDVIPCSVFLYSLIDDHVTLFDACSVGLTDPHIYVKNLRKTSNFMGLILYDVEEVKPIHSLWLKSGTQILSEIIKVRMKGEQEENSFWFRLKSLFQRSQYDNVEASS